MLIAGTGGLGKEILGILIVDKFQDEIVFFDEDPKSPELLYKKYKVLKDIRTVEKYFKQGDKRFITGIGNPRLREKMTLKIEKAGGKFTSVISKDIFNFPFNDKYHGIIIQPGVGISHNVSIGTGCAIHINSTIGHSTTLGKFVNIGPNVSVIGPVEIGDYSYISAQSTVLPGIKIGKHAVITAGKVIARNVADFETV
jgi:sugar O-acyltransferase (sialic acid O-acetyltransferase NeuD family)